MDASTQQVAVTLPDGHWQIESYDVLVISSGVANGFWRNDALEDLTSIGAGIRRAAEQIVEADSIAIIGGGATGVSVAANVRERYPDKAVHFFYSEPQPLPGYHPKARQRIVGHLERIGVELHPGHRALIPEGFALDRFTTGPVSWSTGQIPFEAAISLGSILGVQEHGLRLFRPDGSSFRFPRWVSKGMGTQHGPRASRERHRGFVPKVPLFHSERSARTCAIHSSVTGPLTTPRRLPWASKTATEIVEPFGKPSFA